MPRVAVKTFDVVEASALNAKESLKHESLFLRAPFASRRCLETPLASKSACDLVPFAVRTTIVDSSLTAGAPKDG